jgi:molecular chaperone DnaJ
VKPGTQTDTKVRLRGKGVPTLRNKAVRGDHYVTLVVQVPTKLTPEQKELLEKFDEAMTGKKVEAEEVSGVDHEKDKDKDKSKKKGWFK